MISETSTFQYIVADPLVCHGKWTFKGTRILVSVVRDQIKRGMPPEEIVEEWYGKVSLAAIAEVEGSDVADVELTNQD